MDREIVAVFVIVLLCAAGLALLVYRYDMYEREPWYMLVLAVVLGMGAGWCVGHLEDATIAAFTDGNPSSATRAAIAATHEEAAKLLAVVLIALVFARQFNDPMDGVIYGSFVGLGMAIDESIYYQQLIRATLSDVGTEAVRLVMHLLFGGIIGFALGMARFRMRRWPLALALCAAAAVGIHFSWDMVVELDPRDGALGGLQQVASIVLTLTAMLLYGVLVALAARWSRATFDVNSHRRLWHLPFGKPKR